MHDGIWKTRSIKTPIESNSSAFRCLQLRISPQVAINLVYTFSRTLALYRILPGSSSMLEIMPGNGGYWAEFAGQVQWGASR
jgi:hypothetical protein